LQTLTCRFRSRTFRYWGIKPISNPATNNNSQTRTLRIVISDLVILWEFCTDIDWPSSHSRFAFKSTDVRGRDLKLSGRDQARVFTPGLVRGTEPCLRRHLKSF